MVDEETTTPAWTLPGTIREIPTADSPQRAGGTCLVCGTAIDGTVAYDVGFKPSVRQGYIGINYMGACCSRICAESFAAQAPKRPPHRARTGGRPTEQGDAWIYAFREDGAYPEDTERSGKWMVFVPASRVDAEWERVKAALQAGRLGRKVKVSTTSRPDRRGGEPVHVLIIYTYDGDDEADVWRVRRELRALGYTWPMGWKADEETRQLHYSGGPGQRVSRYWS